MVSCYSYLDMGSLAKDKTSHAVSAVASISLQCGIHLNEQREMADLYYLAKTVSA